MIVAFIANVAEAFTAPRLSARRIIAARPTMLECVLMVALAYALQGSLGGLAIVATAEGGGGGLVGGIGARATEAVLQLMLFAALTAGTYSIGRRFGGVATAEQCAAVIAWHYVVTAFLAPFNVLGISSVDRETGETGALFILVAFSVALSIWLFASFVAEAHGFRRIGGVIIATLGAFFVLAIVSTAILGAAGVAPTPG